jgi:SAM-dependent methyltransferase
LKGKGRGVDLKQTQATFFDEEVDEAFEISRPHGTPRTYRWLLEVKFRESISAIHALVPGSLALCVCGGSGMDSEFLVRSGARVITSDISFQAVKRAIERSRRYQFEVLPIVADVEHLPFEKESVDLVYVHDGLHHLDQPETGIGEMARVARVAVSINEPAKAFYTRFAIAIGVAKEVEESGNVVRRLELESARKVLVDRGFSILHARRYFMYYKHEPGILSRLLSLPGVLQLFIVAHYTMNFFVGRFGNKLVITALRADMEYSLCY